MSMPDTPGTYMPGPLADGSPLTDAEYRLRVFTWEYLQRHRLAYRVNLAIMGTVRLGLVAALWTALRRGAARAGAGSGPGPLGWVAIVVLAIYGALELLDLVARVRALDEALSGRRVPR